MVDRSWQRSSSWSGGEVLGQQAEAPQHELRVQHVGDGGQARAGRLAPGRACPGRGRVAAGHDDLGRCRARRTAGPIRGRPGWRGARACAPTSSRTAPRWPMTMPLWSAAAVSAPMASSGSSSSTRGRRAVPSARACGGQAEARQDGAAEEEAVGIDGIDRGGRAEVDHDDRLAVEDACRPGREQSVGAGQVGPRQRRQQRDAVWPWRRSGAAPAPLRRAPGGPSSGPRR